MGLHLFKLFFQRFLNNKTLRIVKQLIKVFCNYSSVEWSDLHAVTSEHDPASRRVCYVTLDTLVVLHSKNEHPPSVTAQDDILAYPPEIKVPFLDGFNTAHPVNSHLSPPDNIGHECMNPRDTFLIPLYPKCTVAQPCSA